MNQRGWMWVGVVFVLAYVAVCAQAGDGAANGAPPAGVSGDWWAQAQKGIAAEEYSVTWQDKTILPEVAGAYQAPNRAQDLRTYFTEAGPRVVRRTAETPEWVWGLELVGMRNAECGMRNEPPDLQEIVADGNRIEYRRDGLTEWYVNTDKGLEQGFTIGDPLGSTQGRNDAEQHDSSASPRLCVDMVTLDLAVRGDLTPGMMPDGETLEFLSTGGVGIIHYGQLKAYDATGRELCTTIELVDSSRDPRPETRNPIIRLSVDASDAVYPITIDPLATSAAWTAESDQASAYFGGSVSTAGDVNGDGYADVIVGAMWYDNGQTDEGRAYVYLGSASGLSTSAAWTAESDQAGAFFGYSVSMAGDVNGDGYADVIVGADGYDNGQTGEGRAYVYLGSGSGLSTTADWTAESDQAGALFGFSVSTAGDVNGDGYADVIVGARYYSNGQSGEGGAFVWYGSATGLGPNGNPTNADWTAESNQADAYFGRSVSTAGDVNGDGYADVIVGAFYYDNGQTDEGRAYVYLGSASGLSTSAAWTVESDQASAWFGVSVSTAGDVNGDGYADVIVGSYFYDNGQTNEGRTYVYLGSASGLSTSAAWTAESDQAGAFFGYSVSTAGDVNGDGYADVIVGAYTYDNGETNEGRAFVYHGSASGLSTTAGWTAESNQASAWFGYSVSTAGDVNGDGYADVIVGANLYDSGQTDEGRAYVYHGSASGLSGTANWTGESDQASAWFGVSVSTAGDVNGDGYADIIVGAYYYDNVETDEGRAYVYHGSASGLSATPNWTAESGQASAYFASSASTAGDVNGDGYSDVIVGAWAYDNGQSDEGRAYVYHGSASGLSGTPAWTAESDQTDAWFGNSVSTAGDVNGDGYADVIVGAYQYDNGEVNEGRAYVYLGSASGLSTTAGWTAESDQATAYFGDSVSTAGDVNGDGYAEVIVGAFFYTNGQTNEGRAYVYHGSASGLSTTANWTAESNQGSALFGYSVSTAGDVNGDGYADVIVGAEMYDNGQTDEGRAYVYYGSVSGLSTTANWTTESDQASALFGFSVSTAGDVNADGYADVIVGADQYDNGQANEGRAFVYYGNGEAGRGLSLDPRQRRSDDAAPIAHLGKSDSQTGARLAALGRTPFGRGKVKLECEAKPLGTPFDGSGTVQTASWTDTGTAGVELNQLLSSLSAATVYHWRVRLLYNPVSTPYQQKSRWFTMPWNGGTEADFRTATAPPNPPTTPGANPINLTSITWTWVDASNNEIGFKVYADPGTGPPTTLQTTTAADAQSWPHGSLSVNTQYAFQVSATNAGGDSAKTTNYTDWTLIEAVSALTFSSVGTASISVASTNTPSNLSSGSSGLYFANTTASTNSGWQPNNTPWASPTLLTPNTQYAFSGKSRNGDSTETTAATDSKYTLAGPPSAGNNVACDKSTGTFYPADTVFGFTNPAGFGGSTHGGSAYKVSKFKYAWDTVATHTFTGAEPDWNSGSVNQSPGVSGDYYLHLQSFNAENVAGGTLDFGPFRIDVDPPNPPSVNGTTPTNDTTPTWSWTSGGGGGGGYRYQLDSNLGTWTETTEAFYTPASALSAGSHKLYVEERDVAGNWSVDSFFDIFVDLTPPTVTINQAGGQPDPTNVSPINFTAVFSEAIDPATFAGTDVAITGSAGGTKVVVPSTTDNITWNLSVTGMTNGTVIADIAGARCKDLAGNDNAASTSGDHTVTFNATGPTVTINQAGSQVDPTKTSPINFTVVFNTAINPATFTDVDVKITGTAGGTKVVAPSTTDNITWNVAVSGMTDGTVVADIEAGVCTDPLGNPNAASSSTDHTVTYDTTAPTVTISQPSVLSTAGDPVEYTVTYDGADTVSLTADSVHLIATGTARGDVSVSDVKAVLTRVITIDNIEGEGTLTITIDDGTSCDAAGNCDLGFAGTIEVVSVASAMPVAGVLSLGLLAAWCALSGLRAIKRKK